MKHVGKLEKVKLAVEKFILNSFIKRVEKK